MTDGQTSVAFPLPPERMETGLNDALAWLLEVDPSVAAAIAEHAGMPLDPSRLITVRARAADHAEERPDLVLDGHIWDRARRRWRAGRLAIELKLHHSTGTTPAQRNGYPESKPATGEYRVLFVVPTGYSHALPDDATVWTLTELRNVTLRACDGAVARALLQQVWSHYVEQGVVLADVPGVLADDDEDGSLRDFLWRMKRLLVADGALEALPLGKPRAYEAYYYGFHVRRDGEALGWMGFVVHDDDRFNGPAFQIDFHRKRAKRVAKRLSRADKGRFTKRDSGKYRYSSLLMDVAGTLTTSRLMESGLQDIIEAL